MNTNAQPTLAVLATSEVSEVELLRRKLELSMSLVQQLMRDKEAQKHGTADLRLLFMEVAGNA